METIKVPVGTQVKVPVGTQVKIPVGTQVKIPVATQVMNEWEFTFIVFISA